MTRTLGLLLFPDFQLLDAAGPISAFELAGRQVPGAYALTLMARAPGAVASSSGVALQAAPLSAEPFDTLLVAGGLGTRAAARCAETLAWLGAAAGRARRVASVCSGSYLLAAAGLLDDRRATTHWQRSADFARRFPAVRVEADRIYVRDGKVWTSAGITAGIDLALALIGEDLGEEVARRTAQQLVVYHRRPGGQSQFSALLELGGAGGRFAGLLDWMRARLDEPLGVERLAARAAMSPRNFARAFAAETGMTPAKAVQRLRLETARDRVETGAEPIDQVAAMSGFGDPERMRRAFVQAFGQPPQALRRAARALALPENAEASGRAAGTPPVRAPR
ncbi:transcriptional regulator, AraC family with amidase-like domain [Tistlia consotensis]|uniref:Transcriptional regulator, AraC family with amidase-like domain n=1 Tax=Tistlia consotensis USBA 355 TaxID=560819 RepID=A0A1Y6BHY2_9PROT|nr:GlxA family transcriptional regulator [Tistlia consotensis]SMF10216.1 transcriptional regulator, AraC family with amidase-like domain [Tistlia consotensis USBA 355]SNR33913.1 transcriptional regulator, AraC family with amidase-like domain [Tistlia consotensis]